MNTRGSRLVLLGVLVAAAGFGGGLLWWSSQSPPPGDPDLVDPTRVYPATLPAGYAPPIELDDEGRFSGIYGPEVSTSTKDIEVDGTVAGLSGVTICVVPPGGDATPCGRGVSDPRRIETTYKGTRVVISPKDSRVADLDEWRGIEFTSDYDEMTWLIRQAPR